MSSSEERGAGSSARRARSAAAAVLAAAVLGIGGGAATGQEPGGPHLGLATVVEAGDRGPTLLLIPCAGCGAPSWQPFMEANADRFRMIAVTLPGYDGSPRPELPLWTAETVFQDNAVEQLSRLLDDRELAEVVVVGHSFGSHVGSLLAARRPDVVTALVNVDGAPTNPLGYARMTEAELLAQARRVVDEAYALDLQDPERFRLFNAATSQPTEAQRKLHHGMFMASDRVSMLHYWRENLLADRNPTFRALTASYLDLEAISPRSSRPDSALAAYDSAVAEVGRPSRYERVAFFDTSHWIHLDRPRTLGTVIASHLAGVPSPDVGPFRLPAVERTGRGARDLLLLPCLTCAPETLAGFEWRNRSRYRMTIPLWPGAAGTGLPELVPDPAGTPHLDWIVEALARLIQRDSLSRPVVVGHGAASHVGLLLARSHPDLVSGIVAVDPPSGLGDGPGDGGTGTPYHDELQRLGARGPHATSTHAYLALHTPAAAPADTAAELSSLRERYEGVPLPPGARVVLLASDGPDALDRAIEAFVFGAVEGGWTSGSR